MRTSGREKEQRLAKPRTPRPAGDTATKGAEPLAGPRRAPVRGQASRGPAAPAPPVHGLDFLFRPRSVAVAGVSPPQVGFGGVGAGFVIALKDLGFPAIYPVNPKHQEIEGLKCYPSRLDIEGPVDHVISSVPARIAPSLVDDCIAKGVRSLHFFTAGFSETGEEELAELEAQVVGRAVDAGIRVIGPNCMGLYVPASKE